MTVNADGMTIYYVLIHDDPPVFLEDREGVIEEFTSIFEASLAGKDNKRADHIGYSVLCSGQWILEDGIGDGNE